jgi:hypothetical protein
MPSGKLRRIVLRLARQHCSWPVPVRHSFGQLLVRQELKQFVSGLNRSATKHATTLHRLLEVRGICSYVIDPASVQVDRRARRGETMSSDCSDRWWPKVWSVVRVPTVAEEDEPSAPS